VLLAQHVIGRGEYQPLDAQSRLDVVAALQIGVDTKAAHRNQVDRQRPPVRALELSQWVEGRDREHAVSKQDRRSGGPERTAEQAGIGPSRPAHNDEGKVGIEPRRARPDDDHLATRLGTR